MDAAGAARRGVRGLRTHVGFALAATLCVLTIGGLLFEETIRHRSLIYVQSQKTIHRRTHPLGIGRATATHARLAAPGDLELRARGADGPEGDERDCERGRDHRDRQGLYSTPTRFTCVEIRRRSSDPKLQI